MVQKYGAASIEARDADYWVSRFLWSERLFLEQSRFDGHLTVPKAQITDVYQLSVQKNLRKKS